MYKHGRERVLEPRVMHQAALQPAPGGAGAGPPGPAWERVAARLRSRISAAQRLAYLRNARATQWVAALRADGRRCRRWARVVVAFGSARACLPPARWPGRCGPRPCSFGYTMRVRTARWVGIPRLGRAGESQD